MSGSMSRVFFALTTTLVAISPAVASAQWYPAGNPCACSQPVANPCACVQPVAQTCYQTVPVTEYRQVKRTVQKPVVETKYVDQEFTEYRPVVETKTASIPTVQYQNVTECQTVQRNAGYWSTQYRRVCKMSPCDYDKRADIFGWLNRSAYSIRSSFTPNVVATRQYVPRVVTHTVPVTRQVAIRGSRQVTYNVTRMVPHKTTRKVAVNTVRYVSQEIVTNQPVTVMRTVPIGTRTAYMYSPYISSGTATALRPTPDPVGGQPSRTADSRNEEDNATPRRESTRDTGIPATRSSLETPIRRSVNESAYPEGRRANVAPKPSTAPQTHQVPSIVRVSGWRASRRRAIQNGPVLNSPTPLIAGTTP